MTLQRIFLATLLTVLLAGPALAWPVQGQYVDDPTHCDVLPNTLLADELIDISGGAPIPPDEQLAVSVTPTNTVICVPDDGVANDFEVRITNLGPATWQDLFFVADQGYNIGNYDGYVQDLAAPGFTDAFRIDAVGVHQPLIAGDNGDGLFQPGETWSFLVTNFTAGAVILDSIGFSASSTLTPPSTASILANPAVPEPGTFVLAALGAGGLIPLAVRRRRKAQKRSR